MVFYYIIRDVAGPVEGYKTGRTLFADLTQRYPEGARLIADRMNRFGCQPGVWHHVYPHNADAGAVDCDHTEFSPVTAERILVG